MSAVPTVLGTKGLKLSFARAFLKERAALPSYLQKMLQHGGYKFVLGETITALAAYNPRYADKRVATAAGLHNSAEREIVLIPNPTIQGNLYHELGHAADMAVEPYASNTLAFMEAYRADRFALKADIFNKISAAYPARSAKEVEGILVPVIDYYFLNDRDGRIETYADCFAGLHSNNASALHRLMPTCAKLVQENIKHLQQKFS